MAGLGINIGYLLMQILIMVILYLVLTHFLYGPIMNTLEARRERIAKGLEDARQASIARENADAEAKEIKEEARAEAAKIRQEAAANAETTAKGIINEANEEKKTIMTNARAEAEAERDKVLSELRSQVAAIAMAAANKIVGDALDEKRQHEMIADFFSKVPADVKDLSGEKAVITSALPLTDAEKKKVEKAVGASSFEYKVDPNILGGLIIRVGDNVVDNSVSSQMSGLASSLK